MLIIKIGTTQFTADSSLENLSHDELRTHLRSMYPEVIDAIPRETQQDGHTLLEYLPRPGRKG